ncbi:DAD1 [Candida oxycetoniae]|uniref:DASH complex subunit DAD1 n=1 Tax=Candida oxycetoniae TaxID=497107 RepID=A0AAI9SU82_9ASCO|nr:DAD1 [Candida oxycetoniae]KAI3402966.2 DAD1 [Candida oxycetoniae]
MSSSSNTNEYFNKQRDLLLQEISSNLSEVYQNLETLNRAMNESIQIGKEFDDVGRLWAVFYDGMNELRKLQSEAEKKSVDVSEEKELYSRSDVPSEKD